MKDRIFLGMFSILSTLTFDGSVAVKGLPHVSNGARIAHAKELLGKRYLRSTVRDTEAEQALHEFIHQRVKSSLKGMWALKSWKLSRTIIEEANRHNLDPILLLAVIQHESRFKPEALGSHGEIGLMQIKPDTGEWIARKAGLPWWGPRTLRDMAMNVRIGAAYLANLRARFPARSERYLAAYNMGAASLRRALSREILPREYASKVMVQYLSLYRAVPRPFLGIPQIVVVDKVLASAR